MNKTRGIKSNIFPIDRTPFEIEFRPFGKYREIWESGGGAGGQRAAASLIPTRLIPTVEFWPTVGILKDSMDRDASHLNPFQAVVRVVRLQV